MRKVLKEIYKKLYRHFGPQHWWPGDTPFEVIVGAILTQNTSWANVEKAIASLKSARVLSPGKLYALKSNRLAALVRPSGFYNLKAKRLRHFLNFLFKVYGGDLRRMFRQKSAKLREELLLVKGIGPETADSILLYAANKPIFVVDAYTKRILARHAIIKEGVGYYEVQRLFMESLKPNARLYNEYHALLVKLGKTFCKRAKPLCGECPIGKVKRQK